MPNKIIAILEQREGKLKRFAFETVATTVRLATELKLDMEAIVLGKDIENINEIGNYGIIKIVHLKNDNLANYSSTGYAEVIANYINESGADFILLSNTALGKDLAPYLAVKLNAGLIVDAVNLDTSSGELIITRPVYAGKALVEVKFKSTKKVLTIRPNIFKAVSNNGNSLQVEIKEVSTSNLKSKVVSYKKSEGKLDVAEADVIVSGGRGMKGPENFPLIEKLAETLGAAVGASRAVVDSGWRPHREQVGQTGKTVSPSLYIACGISGAIQHLAGMSSAKYIVAINKDKDAPIFNIADYGIAGDIFEIIPALTEEIKKIKS
ncbi:MAG TPA: electron transfer flavoprotein subunit alpha/FixB family protein [Ignavibacteriaceae bacterium]|nr:electron transfer flavoprotein subunit alpha/FixB family protein [Ignavibacteriaceae bacterium]